MTLSMWLTLVAAVGMAILVVPVVLAGVGLIESLMTMTLIDELTETRGSGNRECVGQGIAMVVERVAAEMNALFCRPDPDAIPIYSIFAGRALHGGQSLNVWDSVVVPDFAAKAFPPTAVLERTEIATRYGRELIAECFGALLSMAIEGTFPAVQAADIPEDLPSPWRA